MSQSFIPDHAVQNFGAYKTEKLHADSLPSQGFSIKYDPSDDFIAIGCYNGTKLLYSAKEKKLLESVVCPNQDPVTCLKSFLIDTDGGQLRIQRQEYWELQMPGIFEYLHVPSMKRLFFIEQKENSLHCCDFSVTGEHFATAGRDCHIRIYDENTKSVTVDLGCAEWNNRGHSNRIFSVKFIDENTILSGGWDSVLHLWDIRQGKSVKSVFGPHVAGDSLDYQNGEILVGCYAAKNQVQVWDYNKFQMKEGINWTTTQEKDKVAYVYTASYDNFRPNTIIAGACGANEVKLFHRQGGTYGTSTIIRNLDGGCFSAASSYKRAEFGFTTSKASLFLYTESQ